MLFFDGYASHIRYPVIQSMSESGIVAVSLPAHTSHELQLLDKSVFSPFKSLMERNLCQVSLGVSILDAFAIAGFISDAFSSSHNPDNITKGFHSTGIWVESEGTTSEAPLLNLPFYNPNRDPLPYVSQVRMYRRLCRST